MELADVAREIADRDLYRRRKDGEAPPAYQIGMRVRKYPHWFESRGPGGAQIRLLPGGPGGSVTGV
jgi:hypothetical protein